ncbi:L-lactate dehydrogenase [Candidatus Peregrinibacteria bacterium]|nr:L-lactate dehydrogenase [Candidatus Peregrinibacteria bacterium]
MHKDYTFKISVIGCGNVGATAAYALLLRGVATHLNLIDVQKEKAEGIILDLEHSLSFTSYAKLSASNDFGSCEGSNLIVITAGKKQEQGQTRLDLINANKKIFQSIIPQIIRAEPNAIILVVTNPVDVMTYETLKISGLNPSKVLGSGTILDSARFQFHIGEKIGIHPRSIDAYILGEHGDSSFPVWSFANVLGKPLKDFEEFNDETARQCYEDTKNAAYRIIHDVGYTCYSIATAIAEIAENIKEDTHQVFPLSILLQDYYGHNDVCLSVPCALGKNGIERVLKIPLSEEEQSALAKSVKILKSFYFAN